MSLKQLDSYWFTNSRGTTGIVLFADGHTGNKKAYISHVDGHNEELDMAMIAAVGSKFPLDAAKALFPQHF